MEPRVEALPELLSSEIFYNLKTDLDMGFERQCCSLILVLKFKVDLEKQYCLDSSVIIDHFAYVLQPIL